MRIVACKSVARGWHSAVVEATRGKLALRSGLKGANERSSSATWSMLQMSCSGKQALFGVYAVQQAHVQACPNLFLLIES